MRMCDDTTWEALELPSKTGLFGQYLSFWGSFRKFVTVTQGWHVSTMAIAMSCTAKVGCALASQQSCRQEQACVRMMGSFAQSALKILLQV